jgi:hypothetical protein
MFWLLGLRGLEAQIRFGDEILERQDRFVLSETAQARVAEMYGELGGAAVSAAERYGETKDLEAVLN